MIKSPAIITVIMAMTPEGIIGNSKNLPFQLPWKKLKGDLPRFKKTTEGSVIIMGRKTSETLPEALPDRINVAISRNPEWAAPKGFVKFSSLSQAIQKYENTFPRIFLIGGRGIVEEALKTNIVDEMILTKTFENFPGDIVFPAYDKARWKVENSAAYPDCGYIIETLVPILRI